LTPPENDTSGGRAAPPAARLLDPHRAAQLKQQAAASLAVSKPTRFDGVLKDLRNVLRSAGSSGNTKLVVPEPSEVGSTGRALGAQGQGVDEPRPGDSAPSAPGPTQGEPVPTPAGFVPVTLHLNNVGARQALEMLSREASVNILVASGVTGNVTANLRGMSFDEALDAILRLCNLVAHREGRTIFVYPPRDLPQLDRVLKVFPLDYVAADEVLTSVKGLLSGAGSAYITKIDPNNNRKTQEAIVVEDAPDHVLRVQRYLCEIDCPPRQILIEAHILEVQLKDNLVHGVNFKEIIKTAGNIGELEVFGFADPAATSAFFARINGKNFEALLEALKETTDTKTLASPKVLALNGQAARIQIGEKLGYRETTMTETAATETIKFLELGVILEVTPRVSANNEIIMNVKPKVSDGKISLTGLPEEKTTEVETNVILQDGQGVIIGGLIKEKDSDGQSKIPFFGNLPYVGMLFQARKKESERAEVIIALLPRVLPYAPCPAAREQLEMLRTTTPLFHGPLRRCPRPWEPSLRDALPRRGDRL